MKGIPIVVAAWLALASLAGCDHYGTPIELNPRTPRLTLTDSTAERAYANDALTIAIRLLRRNVAADSQQVEIPDALIAHVYNALAEVYLSNSPQRDTVVNVYHIHTFPVSQSISAGLDTSADWVRALLSGRTPTGNAAFDSLNALLQFAVVPFDHGSTAYRAVVLDPGHVINVVPVAAALARLPGVRYAEPNGYAGDGSDITAYPLVGGFRLDYSYGSGDCPAGCTSRRYWSFYVWGNGQVEFTGVRDAVTPPPRE